jgi:peptide/nickel transport system permease protein
MLSFITRRLIQTFMVLILVSFIVFLLLYLIPGDPARTMLGIEASEQDVAALRSQLGLDRPMMVQFGGWLLHVLQGDLGRSIQFHLPVSHLIAKRLPVSIYVGILALTLSTILGVGAGVVSAVRRGTILDQAITVFANIGVAVPVFWLGILGIYLFALRLGWLPVQGYTSPFENLSLSIQQIIMPVLCLAMVPLATLARQSRSAMLEVIQQDYVRTAWAKGLKEKRVILCHALRNALVPIVTVLGISVRYVVSGSVLIETVFNIPGMGRLIVSGVFNKDFILVQGCILIVALAIAITNLAVDISYAFIDARIRHE